MIFPKSNRQLMRVRRGSGIGWCRSTGGPGFRRVPLKRRSRITGQKNVSFREQAIVEAERRSPQYDRIRCRNVVGKYRAVKVSESNQLCAFPWVKALDIHGLQTESAHVHSLPVCGSYFPPTNCGPIFCIVGISVAKVHLDAEFRGEVFCFSDDIIVLVPRVSWWDTRGIDFNRHSIGQSVPDVFFSGGVAVVIPSAGFGAEDGSTEVALVLPEIGFGFSLRVVHREVPRQLPKPDVQVACIHSQSVGVLILRSIVVHPAEILNNAVGKVAAFDAAETAFAYIEKAVVAHLRPLRTFLAQRADMSSFASLRVVLEKMARVTAGEVYPAVKKTGRARPGASESPIHKAGTGSREIHIEDLKGIFPGFRHVVAHQQMQVVGGSRTKHDLPFLRAGRNEAAESFEFERAVGQNVARRIRYRGLHQLGSEQVNSPIGSACGRSCEKCGKYVESERC